MSSIKGIVEIASKKCLADLGDLLEASLSQISTGVSNSLVNNVTVANHFAQLHDSYGILADKMQHQVIDQVTRSATTRCQEHLISDFVLESCVKASLKDFEVKIEASNKDEQHRDRDRGREIDELHASIHLAEHERDELKLVVGERDQMISEQDLVICKLKVSVRSFFVAMVSSTSHFSR